MFPLESTLIPQLNRIGEHRISYEYTAHAMKRYICIYDA